MAGRRAHRWCLPRTARPRPCLSRRASPMNAERSRQLLNAAGGRGEAFAAAAKEFGPSSQRMLRPYEVAGALVSAVVLAQDEGEHVEPRLRTLRWAGERVVVDSGTSGDMVARARTAGARVVVRPFDDWAGQRNFALSQATRPWVFFVDVDERVPPALAEEVVARVAAAQQSG